MTSMNDVLPAIAGLFARVTGFDATGAKLFDPSLPSTVNTLKYMGPGYGYWIKMNQGSSITFP